MVCYGIFLEWSIKITDKLVALLKAENMQVYFTRLHLPYYQEIIISLTEVLQQQEKSVVFNLTHLFLISWMPALIVLALSVAS